MKGFVHVRGGVVVLAVLVVVAGEVVVVLVVVGGSWWCSCGACSVNSRCMFSSFAMFSIVVVVPPVRRSRCCRTRH